MSPANGHWSGNHSTNQTNTKNWTAPFRDTEFIPTHAPPPEIPWNQLHEWRWNHKIRDWEKIPNIANGNW
jgi:hypothetical protein